MNSSIKVLENWLTISFLRTLPILISIELFAPNSGKFFSDNFKIFQFVNPYEDFSKIHLSN